MSSALEQLVQVAELQSVAFEELSARRISGNDPSEPPRFDLRIDVEPAESVSGEWRQVVYTLRVHFEAPSGEATVAPMAVYRVPADQPDLLAAQNVMDYANEVAVMTLIPYARSALSELSSRVLDEHVLMPVFQRGEVAFALPAVEDGESSPSDAD